MKEKELLRHAAYGVGIIALLNHFLYLCADGFGLSDITKVILFGVIGIAALLLGLFVFHKSLSFGLTLGGVLSTRLAWIYFHFRLTEVLQFTIALTSLVVVGAALYHLYSSEHGLKKKRSADKRTVSKATKAKKRK